MQPFSRSPSLFAVSALVALVLTGCATPPDVGITLSDAAKRADYPRILPLDVVLAQRPDVAPADEIAAPLTSRASALRARAARLRGPIVDQATRSRMREALARR